MITTRMSAARAACGVCCQRTEYRTGLNPAPCLNWRCNDKWAACRQQSGLFPNVLFSRLLGKLLPTSGPHIVAPSASTSSSATETVTRPLSGALHQSSLPSLPSRFYFKRTTCAYRRVDRLDRTMCVRGGTVTSGMRRVAEVRATRAEGCACVITCLAVREPDIEKRIISFHPE